MAQYILRDLDDSLWNRFRRRAGLDGWHLQGIFRQFMEDYAAGRITLSAAAPPRPDMGSWYVTCPNNHQTVRGFTKASAKEWLASGATTMTCDKCGAPAPVSQEDRDTLESWTTTPSPPTR
jgi:hypothetical protein